MIIDKALQIAAGQSWASVNAGTKYGTNWVDLSKTGGLQTYEMPAYLLVRVGTAFTGGTSATISLVTASAAATDEDGTGVGTVTEEVSKSFLEAALTANTIIWKLPIPEKLNRRYLGVKIVTVGNHTTGTLDIDITPHVPMDAI